LNIQTVSIFVTSLGLTLNLRSGIGVNKEDIAWQGLVYTDLWEKSFAI